MHFAHRFARWLRPVADLAVRTVFPADCVGCGRELPAGGRKGTVCDDCWSRFERLARPACLACDEPLGLPDPTGARTGRPDACRRCAAEPPPFGTLRAGGVYGGPLRAAILALKFRRHEFLARHLARWALDEPEVAARLSGDLVVVPVPMHRAKERERGYNPAERIAAELAVAAGQPMRRLLRKVRPTTPQSRLPLPGRRGNVAGSLAPARFAGAMPPRVVLVDDVATSGATLAEAARVLARAGVARIDAVTVARTVKDGGDRDDPAGPPD